MSPTHYVSQRQLELLVQFVENGVELLRHQRAFKAWESCARKLNGLDGGLIKSGKHWKRYWHMYKSRTKAKAAEVQRAEDGVRSGRVCPLTELEERVMAVVGSNAVNRRTELNKRVVPVIGSKTVESLPVRIPLNLSDEDSQQSLPEVFIEEEVENEVSFTVSKHENEHSQGSSPGGAATPWRSREVDESSPASAAPTFPGITKQNQANHVDKPVWAMTKRQIMVEEKIASALTGIDHSLRHMGVTQDRMADALEKTSSLLLQLLQRLPPPL